MQAVGDFTAALRLDPLNSELNNLLQNALRKQKEVSGTPITVYASRSSLSTITPHVVETLAELNLPNNLFCCEVVAQGTPNCQGIGGGFVRVPVSFDGSDSDSDEVESVSEETPVAKGFQHVTISEENEDETIVKDESCISDAHLAAASWKETGNALLLKNDFAAALDAYNHSIANNPVFLPALGNRAQTNLHLKVMMRGC